MANFIPISPVLSSLDDAIIHSMLSSWFRSNVMAYGLTLHVRTMGLNGSRVEIQTHPDGSLRYCLYFSVSFWEVNFLDHSLSCTFHTLILSRYLSDLSPSGLNDIQPDHHFHFYGGTHAPSSRHGQRHHL